ncbi:molybdopterin-guanine dinucleotide biosynthesis protein B [Jannaschia rubra]|uniref:Molybdenum cofactor biosynthesis adapter protein n=1 Tax=Jannaschia rubra TaxID=282197 RepID=A0A0M6XL07_9RHOB|nr:molybdopterin-guanine dinucleotide biosynthesis protein B [Jannaschia rubra]CTQ31608.1 Molybdenum cofactor biosynthesis adapter protein [Jannaschia rubra]SFF76389.1 molybdopterin guanine dinucleotide biosynthesis accessory protein MobB [Jannaschia rubra]
MILMGIVGHKNAGKTTLTEALVTELSSRGLRVSTLKRTHHAVDLETPGTDTHRHRQAGAHQVLLASDRRLTLMEEVREPMLTHLLTRLSPCDVVLAEGWKSGTHPRIEVWRPEVGQPPLARRDGTIIAVACTGDPGVDCPTLDLGDVGKVAEFICSI